MKKDLTHQLPRARTEQLIVKEVDDEVLVYDLKTDQAHCLNDTAAKVWKDCDGNKSVSEIQASLTSQAGAPVNDGVVWLALDQLEKFNLLERVPTAPAVFAGMSRRRLIQNLGVAAIALPVVVSIMAPTSVQAASCGQICSPANPCTTGGCTSCSTGNAILGDPGGTKRCG